VGGSAELRAFDHAEKRAAYDLCVVTTAPLDVAHISSQKPCTAQCRAIQSSMAKTCPCADQPNPRHPVVQRCR
jgi:hypothetical protein